MLGHFWRQIFSIPPTKLPPSKFVDLAPTPSANNAEIYCEALDYATQSDRVLNIALTGPYGSGKSSVIETFLGRYTRTALRISLASFPPDRKSEENTQTTAKENENNKQEIESSILQQILYRVEADKLPFSRFKRIQTPKRWSFGTSLFIAIGIACVWYVISKQTDILSGAYFRPFGLANWFNFLCLSVAGAFVWRVVHSVYTTSFGLSLKSISLKDVQIAPDATDEQSILNRHLDEILYFFQSTNYDLVVIEDLDRFESPEIFVTLREINGLINASEGIKRPIRFLYALRDDIFLNTERTKFFEFIIPIIPVINHSNSFDIVLQQVRRVNIGDRLNRQFLREVSRYLADFRLIQNIFNEYVIYATNLKADSDRILSSNKLLAILIYKNVMPQEFAALHRQEGVLSTVLRHYDDYLLKIESEIRTELSQIEATLAAGEAQFLTSHTELRKLYALAILERLPENVHKLEIDGERVSWTQLSDGQRIEALLGRSSIQFSDTRGNMRTVQLSGVEAEVDPVRNFAQRRDEIELKSADFRRRQGQRSRALKAQLASLRTRRFNEVVRENTDLVDQIFSKVGENRELLKYLILEGHLDDTYYQYISLFHGEQLSPNDNNFLIQIRAYSNPSPDFPLDNIGEVIASMRLADFGHRYVLNRTLVDYMLSHVEEHRVQIENAAEFIGTNMEECEDFFRSYYVKGKQVAKLIQILSTRWPQFAALALDGTNGAAHAGRILAYAPDLLIKNGSSAGALKSLLSQSLRQVLEERVDFDLSRLRLLAVQIEDVESLAEFPSALAFVAQEGLYRISIQNIRHILDRVVKWPKIEELERRHFSTLREASDETLMRRIYSDFSVYVRDVLLALKTNNEEGLASIAELLSHDDVDFDLREQFLKRQTAKFPSFDQIPHTFHKIVLEGQQIETTWENCLGFINSEGYDTELLTAYLQKPKIAAELSRQPIPGDAASLPLRRYVLESAALSPQLYRSYVRQLPKVLDEFPDVDDSKIKILIEERKVRLNPASFGSLREVDLRVLFLAANFPAYESDEDSYVLDDEFRAKLLGSTIAESQKLKLVAEMDQNYVAGDPSVAADVGALLEKHAPERRDYSVDFIKSVVLNARATRVQISLLNRFHRALSDSQVRDVIQGLPGSLQDIAAFGKSPKIENSDTNRQFASWLKQRNIISSFGDTLLGDEIRINTFRTPR